MDDSSTGLPDQLLELFGQIAKAHPGGAREECASCGEHLLFRQDVVTFYQRLGFLTEKCSAPDVVAN